MTPPRVALELALTGALPLIYAALLNWGLPPITAFEPWLPYWDDGATLKRFAFNLTHIQPHRRSSSIRLA